MALRFYNTLTQQVETFTPLNDNLVRMYTCGPTVYNFIHIGNLRTFTFQDILRRVLRARRGLGSASWAAAGKATGAGAWSRPSATCQA